MSLFLNTDTSPEIYTDRESYWTRVEELQRQAFRLVDLHVHSAQSDGLHSLKTVVARAVKLGIMIAVTDHNRIPELKSLTQNEISHIIPAIEITSREAVDILCYFDQFSHLESFFQEVILPHKKSPYKVGLSCEEILCSLEERKCIVSIPHPDTPSVPLRMNFMRLHQKGGLSQRALAVIDCIEVFNASRKNHNMAAITKLTALLQKQSVVGSDAHTKMAVGNAITFCHATSNSMFLDKLRKGETQTIAISSCFPDRLTPKLKMAWLHLKGFTQPST